MRKDTPDPIPETLRAFGSIITNQSHCEASYEGRTVSFRRDEVRAVRKKDVRRWASESFGEDAVTVTKDKQLETCLIDVAGSPIVLAVSLVNPEAALAVMPFSLDFAREHQERYARFLGNYFRETNKDVVSSVPYGSQGS